MSMEHGAEQHNQDPSQGSTDNHGANNPQTISGTMVPEQSANSGDVPENANKTFNGPVSEGTSTDSGPAPQNITEKTVSKPLPIKKLIVFMSPPQDDPWGSSKQDILEKLTKQVSDELVTVLGQGPEYENSIRMHQKKIAKLQ